MVISVVGLIGVSISLINEKNIEDKDKVYVENYPEEE
jgi:hypothetical protein